MSSLIVLTGCSSNHLHAQVQMLETVWRHEPDIVVWFYDLGITRAERHKLEARFPKLVYKLFDFSQYPSFFNIRVRCGAYSWKATIIWLAMQEHRGPVFWMDAGDNIVGNLEPIRRILADVGIYSPVSCNSIETWTVRSTSDRMHTTVRSRKRFENLSGGIFAADYRNPVARQIVARWARLSACKEVIAPPGSSRANHRQDQAVLTALVDDAQQKGALPKRMEKSMLMVTVHNE